MSSKIEETEWKILTVIAGAIDVIQWFVIPTVVGAVVDDAVDVYIGVAIGAYLSFRGVSLFKHTKRFAALVGGSVAEIASVSVLPAWIFDIIYIHSDVKKEEAANQEILEQENFLQANARRPYYYNGIRAPQTSRGTMATGNSNGQSTVRNVNLRPLNRSGMRRAENNTGNTYSVSSSDTATTSPEETIVEGVGEALV